MNRVDLINDLARRWKHHSYLEIGCAGNRTFNAVEMPHKVGVDPSRGGTLRMTSDEFFRVNREKFGIVFVDGLHLAEQVLRDVSHSLKALTPNGVVIVHDCLPAVRAHQERAMPSTPRAWTGDVWKAIVTLRSNPESDLAVVDADWGLGIVLPRANTAPFVVTPRELTWDNFSRNRNELLRVINEDGISAFLDGSFRARPPAFAKAVKV